MKIPTRGGLAALAVCAAAAVASVSPASAATGESDRSSGLGGEPRKAAPDLAPEMMEQGAAEQDAMARDAMAQAAKGNVPVMVPLQTMETGLPLDAPRIAGTVPAMPVAQPDTPRPGSNRLVPDPLLPSLATQGDAPSAFVEAPVPTLDPDNAASAARATTSSTPLTAVGPQARLDLPYEVRKSRHGDTERIGLPDAELTTPLVQGAPGADIGMAETGEQSRLPFNDIVSGTLGAVSGAAGSGLL